MERTNTVPVNEMLQTATDALGEELRITDQSISYDTPQDYDEFKSEIILKYDALKKHREKLEQFEESYVLIYKLEQDQITHRFFNSTNEALKWSYRNKGLMEKKLPVILISNKFPNPPCSQVMPKKKTGVMVLGTEASPKTEATLLVPYSTFKPRKMVFFLDTGADGGSVGYNPEVIENFIFSVEEIERDEKPIVFGQLSVEGRDFQEIYCLDVDPDRIWNALGMEQIKHFDLFHSSKKGITKLLKPENVHVSHNSITFPNKNPAATNQHGQDDIAIGTGSSQTELDPSSSETEGAAGSPWSLQSL